ncbi:MAG: hypothetical protein JOZ10_03715 [Acidobacteria bacterium]|nr:hypothetical protein [Acidobacteriota bacterium]MBV9146806.1 hypothetical protein [Acidobacteriota bacterium]MBV9435988.1 hypothetical protein [Acidobacteriota bacterium]
MILLLWAFICIVLGSDSGSAILATVVFLGGIAGSEIGLKVASKISTLFKFSVAN